MNMTTEALALWCVNKWRSKTTSGTIPVASVIDAVIELLPLPDEGKRDTRRQRAMRALQRLIKKCTECGEIKSIEDFFANQRSRDKHSPNCKACANGRLEQSEHESLNAMLALSAVLPEGTIKTNRAGKCVGDSHGKAVLSDEDVCLIRDMRGSGFGYKSIARITGTPWPTVAKICQFARRKVVPIQIEGMGKQVQP